MKKYLSFPVWLLMCATALGSLGEAAASGIENDVLKISIDESQNTIIVLDKRTGRIWKQDCVVPMREPTVVCPLAAAAPAMDGGETGWAGIQIPVGHEKIFNQGVAASQVSGSAKLMHDAERLYVRMAVSDSKVVLSPSEMEKPWESDSIELWFGKTAATFVVTAPSDTAKASEPSLKVYWSGAIEGGPSVETHLFLTADGYTAVLSIPLTGFPQLHDAVANDTGIAFAIGINSADAVGERKERRYFPSTFTLEAPGALLAFSPESATKIIAQNQSGAAPTLDLVGVDSDAKTIMFNANLPGIRKSGDAAQASFKLAYALDPVKPDLTITFKPQMEGDWSEVSYPYVFSMPEEDSYLLFPHSEGLLVPVHKNAPDYFELNKDYIHSGFGPYCACLGLVNLGKGDGLLIYFPDPELAGYEMVDVDAVHSDVTAPSMFWRGNKYKFDRDRRLTFSFQDEGGYVAMAKKYQQFVKDAGAFKTLKEKAQEIPAVNQMIGAPVFWIAARETPLLVQDVARMMAEDGIDKALIEVCDSYFYRMKGREKEAVELEGVVKQIRDMGYVVSRYDEYRECAEKDDTVSVYDQMHTEAFPDYCLHRENGEMQMGWYPKYLMNPELALELAKKKIPENIKRYPYNGRFIDCVGTCTMWEAEDWNPEHPCDTYDTKRARKGLLELVNSLGLVAGTEGAVDYVVPNLHWIESPMSLVKWTVLGLPIPGSGPAKDFPEYQVSISTKYRIPFYSLVHHSEVLITWRYEESPQRMPQYWQDKNLWSVLYGNPLLFFVDKDTYIQFRKEIAQSYRYVCKWTEKVGDAEMVSHRFVTPDRSVQESVFSTGDGVVVNFSKQPYQLSDTQIVPPRSYRTFNTATPGVYSPPPVAEIDYEKERNS